MGKMGNKNTQHPDWKWCGLLLLIYVAVCLTYGFIRCKFHRTFRDPLQTPLGVADLDGWSVVHFFEFFVVALVFYPSWRIMAGALLLSAVWEAFEWWYGRYNPGWLGVVGDCSIAETDELGKGQWWHGKGSDLVMNVGGIGVGVLIRFMAAGKSSRA